MNCKLIIDFSKNVTWWAVYCFIAAALYRHRSNHVLQCQ